MLFTPFSLIRQLVYQARIVHLAQPKSFRPSIHVISQAQSRNLSMKRKATSPVPNSRKAARKTVAGYCDAETRKDENGEMIWPAPEAQMEGARAFLRDCAQSQKKTLIIPDKDADGLSSGVIIHRTLVKLGLDEKLLDVYIVKKGSDIHEEDQREAIKERGAGFVIVLDQGSRGGSPVVDGEATRCLIIDHHLSDEFPERAEVVSACHYPPVATTALTTFEICKELHPDIASECAYLCAIGTVGDLGGKVNWQPPFPSTEDMFANRTKKLINDCVSFINAPRRTAKYDVLSAWNALSEAKDPKEILNNKRLAEARMEINAEVKKQTRNAPKFSKDGKIAVIKIDSEAQVHPVVATTWANTLKSSKLEIVMAANYGYLPNRVNFSCRIARCALGKDTPVNIIESLKAVAGLDEGDLVKRLGENFARGHKEASGGIVGVEEFEELMTLLKVGEKPDKVEGAGTSKAGKEKAKQKNTLDGYFRKE